jgi:hypothetical protein
LNAYFGNSIIYGDLENEIEYDSASVTGAFNYLFDHCLLRIDKSVSTTNPLHYISVTKNTDPKFSDIDNGDYTLDTTSIAIDLGDISITSISPILGNDLKNEIRPKGPGPDLGAFEKK